VELVSGYDLLPTLCDVINVDPPERNLCGRSYKLMATGKLLPKKQAWRKTVFAQYQDTGMARIERYKLVWRNQGKGPNELYDLALDAGERINQAANEQFVSLKTSLSGELEQWKQQFSK
jgi:arylsulfatase A-like enzyme